MALTIPAIKDAAFLDIMNALNRGQPSVNSTSTFEPLDPMGAARSGFFNMPKQYPVAPAFNTTPLEEAFTEFTNANTLSPFSIVDQQDAQDVQTQQSEQEKLLRLYDTALSTTNQKNTNSQAQLEGFGNSMDAISKQDATDTQLAQSSYDQLGKMFPTSVPSFAQDITPQAYDINYLKQLFEANKDKNFVQRVLSPEKSLITGKNSIATHKMGYSTIGEGNARMYPTVVEQMGELVQLDPKTAYNYAVANKEFIDLPEDAAKWVSENYKTLWGDTSTTPKENADSEQVPSPDGILPQTIQPTNKQSTAKQPPVVTPQGVQPAQGKSIAPTQQATAPMDDVLQNTLHARIDALRQSSPDLLTQQQLLHLEDMVPMDVKGAEAIITGLESQAAAMGNNRGPFGGGYNQYLETLSHVEQGERDVVEKYKKLFEDRGVILKDKPTPNWFMLAAGLMIGGKGGAAFLNGYTQSYQARYQNERNSKLQIVEDQMKALEMDAKMLGSEENFSKARLSVAADTAKILGQMKDTIMARYTVEKAPELQNLLKWEVQNTLNKNGEYTQSTFPDLQKYMLATKIAKTPKEAEVAARIYLSYKQDSIQKMSSQMLYNIWSTNLQTEAIAQRKAMQSTVPDMLTTGKTMYFTVPPNTKESQLPVATLNKFQSSGTLPVLSKVAQLISTGVIPLSLTSTPYELTSGLPNEVKEDEAYKKYYGSNPAQLLKDVNTMFNAFNAGINLPKLQEEVNKNTGEMASAYTTIMKYISPSVAGLSPDAQRVVKTMVGQVAFSTPELATNPSVLKTFTQYLASLGNDKLKKLATPTNIYDDIDYASVLPQASGLFLQFVNGLSDKTSKLSQIDQQNAVYLAASKNDTKLLKEGLTTLQSYKSGVSTSLATTPTAAINTSTFGENIGLEDYTSFSTAAMKAALYSAISSSLPREHPELKLFIGDSDATISTIASKTKPDMRDEFNLYNVYIKKTDPTKFTNTIDDYISKLNTSAINDTYGSLAYSVNLGGGDITEFSNTKLNTPKVKAILDSILTLKNELANSSEPLNDASTRRKLQQLDQALKRYRELLSK